METANRTRGNIGSYIELTEITSLYKQSMPFIYTCQAVFQSICTKTFPKFQFMVLSTMKILWTL